MQSEMDIKIEMCEIGKRVYNRGMVAANDGNFSVKLSDNEFLCTPTGVSKGFMTPEYICKVDAEGNVIEANEGFKPSSEIKMHMRVYKEREDVKAVVHAHPMYATTFAVCGLPLTGRLCRKRCFRLGQFRLQSMELRLPWRFQMRYQNIFLTMMRYCLKTTAL